MPEDSTSPASAPVRQRAEVDWNAAASGPGALALPPVMPSTHALLGNLPAQASGLILDLACGTGSPAFEAARRNPGARVLGIDRADQLIETARAVAAAHAVGNAGFEVMSLDQLTLPDKSVDAAISQFAFLQEGDVPASVRELGRVLKDGAPFSVAAWDAMERNTLFSRAALVLHRHVPAGLLPDFGYLTELATPGMRERLLRQAGISALHTQMFSWPLTMPSAAAVWAVIAAPVPFGRAMDSLAGSELEAVRRELEQETAEFRAADGSYTFPLACRLFWGSKQA
ncbi:MAG TPA: class I SAM-dependent methyltransferase [Trebonia sp.]|nr:class I SAM-dependent methyltransferase [Trebonia sp.]